MSPNFFFLNQFFTSLRRRLACCDGEIALQPLNSAPASRKLQAGRIWLHKSSACQVLFIQTLKQEPCGSVPYRFLVSLRACCLSLRGGLLIGFLKRHGLPRWLSGKESAANAEDATEASSVPGSGRSPGGGNGNLLQYSFSVFNLICTYIFFNTKAFRIGEWPINNAMIVSGEQQRDSAIHTHISILPQAPLLSSHSSILAWEIPWTVEPGGLWLQRVGHNGVSECYHQKISARSMEQSVLME